MRIRTPPHTQANMLERVLVLFTSNVSKRGAARSRGWDWRSFATRPNVKNIQKLLLFPAQLAEPRPVDARWESKK